MSRTRTKGEKRKIPWSWIYIGATVVAVLLFGLFNQEFGNVFATCELLDRAENRPAGDLLLLHHPQLHGRAAYAGGLPFAG